MIQTKHLVLVSTLALWSCSTQSSRNQSPPIATVNDRTISSEAYVNNLTRLSQLPGSNLGQDKGKFDLLKDMIDEELLFQEAVKEKLYLESPDIKTALAKAMVRKKIDESKKPVADDALKKYFQEHQTEIEKVHAAHILIKPNPKDGANADALAQKKAEAVLREIASNKDTSKDFAYFAKKYSQDDSNKNTGGDLSWFKRDQMVPEFSKAAFELTTPGQLSSLVKSSFGYHVIRLIETQVGFEANRAGIQKSLQVKQGRETLAAFIKSLQGKSKISIENELVVAAKPKVLATP